MLYLLLFEEKKEREREKKERVEGRKEEGRKEGRKGVFSKDRHVLAAVPHWDFPRC
jgi:hypothetical protein